MAITISGSGITSENIADGTIVNADVADVAASKLTGALPALDGSALTNLPGGGKVLQVLSDTDSTSQTTTSGTPQNTNLYVDITPSSTSSKIFISYSVVADNSSSGRSFAASLHRDSTDLAAGTHGHSRIYGSGSRVLADVSASVLDSPNTTSSVRYMVKFWSSGNTGASVRWYGDNLQTMVVMEIGA